MPPAYTEAPSASSADAPALAPAWWLGFGSPQLTSLIEEALTGSADIRIAAERITQAELALRIADASLLPNIGSASAQSIGRSDGPGADGSTRRGTSVSLAMSYEIDLWGRLAAGVQAQQQAVAISRFDAETVRLTLTTSVASTYFQLLVNARPARHRARQPRHRRARAQGRRRALPQRRGHSARRLAANHHRAESAHRADSARSHRAADHLGARLLIGRVPQGFGVAGRHLRADCGTHRRRPACLRRC